MKRKLFISKENLEKLYLEENKSTHEIGRFLGVNSKTVWYWLKKHFIPIRSRSESLKGERSYMYGKHHSEERRKKISEKQKGRTISEETRQKISLAKKQWWSNPLVRQNMLKIFRSENYRAQMSDIMKKRAQNGEWGKKLSEALKTHWRDNEKRKKQHAEFHRKRWANPKTREKLVNSMILAQNKPEVKEKISKASRKRWANPEYKSRVVKKIIKGSHKKPNNPEKRIIEITKRHSLPFKYVGDGAVIIKGHNPDFISTDGSKKIIEVFGRVYHDPEHTFLKTIPLERQEDGRKKMFSEAGYKTLILWDDELDNEELLVERIGGLING